MKTPEQLAEEYSSWVDAGSSAYKGGVYEGFLAGYQAAKDQLADADKVMNSPKKLDSWISVKDRLPEVEKEILWYHEPGEEFAIGLLHDGVEKPFFTHWMPLPKPPEDE